MPVEFHSPDRPVFPAPHAGAPGARPPSGSAPPDGLPQLGRGRHALPEEGACLMEYTSVLAGLRFSDRPRCTAPTLAGLARLVNDATSDAARPALAARAPELSIRGHLSCEQSAAIVAGALSSAADALAALDGPGAPPRQRVRRLRRQAARERARASVAASGEWAAWVRAVEVLHRNSTARLRSERAVRALSALDVSARDRALAALLDDALERSRPAGTPVPERTAAAGV
jgi:hypothetical protein